MKTALLITLVCGALLQAQSVRSAAFAFNFARPGASGVALIDGKAVKLFRYEQRLSVRAHVFAGNHQFVLYPDKPAQNTFVSSNDDFEYCQAK